MMSIRILQGDVRERLADLPSDSFDCIVTSPPYWGLRDYGTGSWIGGDLNCGHRSPTMREGRNEDRAKRAGSAATNSYQLLLAQRSGCGKCGAHRVDNQIGLEPTLTEYLDTMVDVCRELRRVLKPSGVFFLNIGDSYAGGGNGGGGSFAKDGIRCAEPGTDKNERPYWRKGRLQLPDGLKAKDLCMVPNRLAIRLQEDGWYIRSEIIWHKPNPMPESVTDRPTSSHEKIWLLTKSERYWYDAAAIAEQSITIDPRRPYTSQGAKSLDGRMEWKSGERRDGDNFTVRNSRNVWTIASQPYSEAHFATFPPELAERCIKAGCPAGGHVLDPFGGAGTTGLVADRLGRDATMIELNPNYVNLIKNRIADDAGMFAQVAAE